MDKNIYPSTDDEESYDENDTTEYKSNNLNKINWFLLIIKII